MLAAVTKHDFVAGFDLGARAHDRVRQFHPLAGHQVVSFPAAKLEMSVVFEDQRSRVTRNGFALNFGCGALVATRNAYGLGAAGGVPLCQGNIGVSYVLTQVAAIGFTKAITPSLVWDGTLGYTHMTINVTGLGYGQSKSANVLLAVEITRRWADEGILANALMPGGIETALQRHVDPERMKEMIAKAKGAMRLKTPATAPTAT